MFVFICKFGTLINIVIDRGIPSFFLDLALHQHEQQQATIIRTTPAETTTPISIFVLDDSTLKQIHIIQLFLYVYNNSKYKT